MKTYELGKDVLIKNKDTNNKKKRKEKVSSNLKKIYEIEMSWIISAIKKLKKNFFVKISLIIS